MFNFFKKKNQKSDKKRVDFDIELTASILAYEIARSDGDISSAELSMLSNEMKKVALKANKSEQEIHKIIEEYSKNSTSFHEFINDINRDYSISMKRDLIKFLFDVAYADKVLEVTEERLIRRIADLINIKDIEVLKIKDISKTNQTNNL